jgi:hypothetical protein
MVIEACKGSPMIPNSGASTRRRERGILGNGAADMGFESVIEGGEAFGSRRAGDPETVEVFGQ